MCLPYGSGAQRLITEFAVDLINRLTCLFLDYHAGKSRIQLLHVLAQLLKLLAVALRQKVYTAGHDLADFDISGAQILKRDAQLLGGKTVGVEIVLGKDCHDLCGAALRCTLLPLPPFLL